HRLAAENIHAPGIWSAMAGPDFQIVDSRFQPHTFEIPGGAGIRAIQKNLGVFVVALQLDFSHVRLARKSIIEASIISREERTIGAVPRPERIGIRIHRTGVMTVPGPY